MHLEEENKAIISMLNFHTTKNQKLESAITFNELLESAITFNELEENCLNKNIL